VRPGGPAVRGVQQLGVSQHLAAAARLFGGGSLRGPASICVRRGGARVLARPDLRVAEKPLFWATDRIYILCTYLRIAFICAEKHLSFYFKVIEAREKE